MAPAEMLTASEAPRGRRRAAAPFNNPTAVYIALVNGCTRPRGGVAAPWHRSSSTE